MVNYVDIARLTGKKHLNGRLVACPATGLPLLLREGMHLHLVPPVIDAPRSVTVNYVDVIDESKAIVGFDEVGDATTADMLIGCHCLIAESDLADEDIEAIKESADPFEGWLVVDRLLGEIGRIIESEERFEQVLLTVQDGKDPTRQYLIPLADDLIVDADADAATITIDCPKGLLDL